jgi:dATP pyrophosphohydrolase
VGRAPFEVVVFPFRLDSAEPRFAVFSRSDASYWQAIAGGGEDDETPVEAARREMAEEAGIKEGSLYQLNSMDMVSVIYFTAHKEWPPGHLRDPAVHVRCPCGK